MPKEVQPPLVAVAESLAVQRGGTHHPPSSLLCRSPNLREETAATRLLPREDTIRIRVERYTNLIE